jgi:glycosyltransferase involved in cell wall biosynthesis
VLQQPLISVITVCYNSASTLDRALQSVVKQDWPRIEHIVIDGGSVDGSLEILQRHLPHLAKVVSEPDAGIYDAMNKGLERATGDIICFLNSDDYYASSDILSRVAVQMRDEGLHALMGDVALFHFSEPGKMIRRYRSGRFSPNRLAWGWMPAHPALFLRTDVVRRVGRFKTDFRIAGDFEFIIRAFIGHELLYRHVPDVLVYMQSGGASTLGLRSKIRLNQEVLRACRENGLRTNIFKILSKYPMKIWEMINLK